MRLCYIWLRIDMQFTTNNDFWNCHITQDYKENNIEIKHCELFGFRCHKSHQNILQSY